MIYLELLAAGVLLASILLTFGAFVPLDPRKFRDAAERYFRPRWVVYGFVVFLISCLLDVVIKMNLLALEH